MAIASQAMASLRVALRLSLIESGSSNAPTKREVGEETSLTIKSERTDKDKRKLPYVSAFKDSPRRNQRRATNFELSEEEMNNNGLRDLSSLIAKGSRVVVVSGAGLSCASGIPAFRTSKSSKSAESKFQDDGTIWGRHVESMGTRAAFLKDPLYWYESFWLQSFAPVHMMKQPSGGHEALSELTTIAPNITLVTQNVDGLQQHTTTVWDHENKLIEAHGRVGLYRCSSDPDDGCPYAEDDVLEPHKFTSNERDVLGHGLTTKPLKMKEAPKCPHCNKDFFQFEKLQGWFDEAEVFVFVGTSFSVTLTALALQVARSKSIPMFNFNTEKDLEKAASNTLQWKNICGKAEELLPKLLEMTKSELGIGGR